MISEELKSKIFIGTVEENSDPKKLGRCRVRVLNIFDTIPTEDIPWATPWKDLNGNQFIVPEIGKVVSVVFDEGNPYKPEYIFAEHYNINLERKLSALSDGDYTSMRALMFDHKTQIYSNDGEGLMVDYKYNNVNIKSDSININLKDNQGKLALGDEKADQQAVLGTNFMSWFDEFVDNLLGPASGQDRYSLSPFLGNLGAPVQVSPVMLELLNRYKVLRDVKFLSNNVYINSNFKISTVSDNSPNRQNSPTLGDAFKSTSKEFKKQTENVDQSGDFLPSVDINNQANISNDPTDTTPKTAPAYIDGPGTGVLSSFAKEMVGIAKTQVGVVEQPRNSNSGPQVEGWYQRSTWLKGTGFAWCAAFICYLFREASKKPDMQYSFKLPQTAGAYDFENWARNNSNYVDVISGPFTRIIPGDIIIFNFSHIGIAVDVSTNGSVSTIEGNTNSAGSREGDGVYQKNRKFSVIKKILRIKYNPNLVREVDR
jgi:hypothetical protein